MVDATRPDDAGAKRVGGQQTAVPSQLVARLCDAVGAEIAKASLARLENEQRYASDQIKAEIRRAVAGLEGAYEQTIAARSNLEFARKLEAAEDRQLMLGTSNLINVNIRELQTAEAGRALIDAQAEYFLALASYRAAAAEI